MGDVVERSAVVGHLVAPRAGSGVCVDCFNFTRGYDRCYACSVGERHLDIVLPISYSVAHEELHRMLAGYKRSCGLSAERSIRQLAATLTRFLAGHESCLAQRVGARRFDVVTTVPSGDRARDATHPLRRLVGELSGVTRDRHQRLLLRTDAPLVPRRFAPDRYRCVVPVGGRDVLLIDDTWTTGASAQSAAAALRAGGARKVVAVVIGRHVNREWHDNDLRLGAAADSFDWSRCALCAGAAFETEARAA